MRTIVTGVMMLAAAGAVHAQSLPPYVPVNPAIASRSALYAQPFVVRDTGSRLRLVADYSNAVEVSRAGEREYAFDAEVLQVDVWYARPLGDRTTLLANLPLRAAHAGFLDGFLNWYHDVIGLRVPARNRRTENRFTWDMELPDTVVRREPTTLLGDARVGLAIDLHPAVQLTGSVTLPTATIRTDGWGRGTIGTSLAATIRLARGGRTAIDAGIAAGWTPSRGGLARYQRELFAGGMLAGWWRVLGQQALFATAWVQSPSWQHTGFAALDRAEVTLDFGALLNLGQAWPQLQVGMTEDLLPSGPAVDAGFKLGVRW